MPKDPAGQAVTMAPPDPMKAGPSAASAEAELIGAIQAMARQAGRPMSKAGIAAQIATEPDGRPALASIRALFEQAGLDLAVHEAPASGLRNAELPAMVAVGNGYQLLEQPLADPSSLRGGYAGHWLNVHPRPGADHRSEIPGVGDARAWFWKVLWGLRHYYVYVAIATIVANVLSLALSLFTMNVYDRVVPNRTYETLWVLAIGTLIALVFELIARTLRGWLLDQAGRHADVVISGVLFRRVMNMRLSQKPASSGSYASNLRDFEAVREVLTSVTLTAVIDLPFFLLFVAVIAAIAPALAIVPVVAVALVALVGLLAQRPLARCTNASMKEASQRQGLAVEAIEGLETLKVNNALGWAIRAWDRHTLRNAQLSLESRHVSNVVFALTALIQQGATLVTVVMGVYLIHEAALSLGGLIGIVILCGRAIAPSAQLAGIAVRFQQARSAFGGLQAIMDKELDRRDDRGYISMEQPRGLLELRAAEFSYDPRLPATLKPLNLRIAPGERVAILGRTGSGKSTLLRMLAGLYEPSRGHASLDGLELSQIDPADLRNAVGLMTQDPRLFLGTLRENLELAHSEHGDARLVEAMRLFGVDAIASQHPRGLDMMLGENGLGLSGGQKMLVGLARIALRDPPVVLLDEPTGALDAGTEAAILRSLGQWLQSPPGAGAAQASQRTLVMVTHRPQMLDLVQRIIVLEQGRIILDGPKAQVLEQLAKGISVTVGH